jgi:hypothetical protein
MKAFTFYHTCVKVKNPWNADIFIIKLTQVKITSFLGAAPFCHPVVLFKNKHSVNQNPAGRVSVLLVIVHGETICSFSFFNLHVQAFHIMKNSCRKLKFLLIPLIQTSSWHLLCFTIFELLYYHE